MINIDIDETTEIGMDILRRIAENPEVGRIKEFEMSLDDNDISIGYALDEVFATVDRMLSQPCGVDFAEIHRLVESGELVNANVMNESLSRSKFIPDSLN
jgi:hypothetical protein